MGFIQRKKPLQRKVPLKQKAPLKRSTVPLKRTPLKKSRKPVAKESVKQRKRNAAYSKLRTKLLWKEDRVCCYPGCEAPATDVHHPGGRSEDELLNEEEFRWMCRIHHDWAHDHPEAARELDLSVFRISCEPRKPKI